MSLLSGLVFLLIGARLRPGQRFPLLATTRLGVLGVATFFGYLLTTPFLPAGDLGKDRHATWKARLAEVDAEQYRELSPESAATQGPPRLARDRLARRSLLRAGEWLIAAESPLLP